MHDNFIYYSLLQKTCMRIQRFGIAIPRVTIPSFRNSH